MAHRRFMDERGVMWDVITIDAPQATVREHMEQGWTSFRSSSEVRRITPARDVDHLSEQELRMLLAQATPYGPPRRLIE
jgi:hypothetical protein